MDNYICINGRKVELTTEQLKALGIEVTKKNPFKRKNPRGKYWSITESGRVICHMESSNEKERSLDESRYNNANYCTDKDLLIQRALYETLSRLLWRFSMFHDGDKIDPQNAGQKKYVIRFDSAYNKFDAIRTRAHNLEETLFCSKEIAELAIEEVIKPFIESHPDFKW